MSSDLQLVVFLFGEKKVIAWVLLHLHKEIG